MDVIRPIPMCHGQNMVMAYGHPTILRNPLCLMRIFSPIPGWPSPNGFISNFSWLVININVIKHYQIPNDINDSCLNPQLRKSSINPWKSMKWSHPAAAAPQALSLRSSSAALRHGAKGPPQWGPRWRRSRPESFALEAMVKGSFLDEPVEPNKMSDGFLLRQWSWLKTNCFDAVPVAQ